MTAATTTELFARWSTWLSHHNPRFSAGKLPSAATEQEIEYLESSLQIKLPKAYVELLQIHNGSNEEDILPNFNVLASARKVVELHQSMLTDKDNQHDRIDSEENTIINRGYEFHPRWIPISYDFIQYRSMYCIDYAPGPAGNEGQILCWYDNGLGTEFVAKSFQDWLQELVEGYEQGRYVYASERIMDVEVLKEWEQAQNAGGDWCFIL